MISHRKEPLFDAHLTHPCGRFPIPVPTQPTRAGALSLVCADTAGDPGTDHRFAHLQSAARHRDAVRGEHRGVALLHLHGLGEAAVGVGVGGTVAGDSQPAGRGAAAAGARRFDQREDRQAYLRLSAHLRSCRQDQPEPLAVGADHRHGGALEADPRALELYPPGLRVLPAPRDPAPRLPACAPQGGGLRRQVRPGGGADRAPGCLLRPGPGAGRDRQLVRQQRADHATDAKGNFMFDREVALDRSRPVLDMRRKR